MTPVGFGPGARRGGRFSGEVSPAQLRSWISASPPGRAERPFPGEFGSARMGEPGYQTAKFSKISVEMRIAGLARPTKHTLSNER
jgi:hypothetical protein